MLVDCMASTGCVLKHRGLSEDERSENALLRSRIDEQSQLIKILKRHSDEAVQTANSLDKHNTLLIAECKQARDDLALQMKRCDLLESRFNDLASNHQQMTGVRLLYFLLSGITLYMYACEILLYILSQFHNL